MSADAIAPDGSEVHLLVNDAERASLVEIRLAAGRVSRPVRHRTVEEVWLITSGRARVWRREPGKDGAITLFVPGDALTIPTGWEFQFAADGDGELRFACFTCPPWPGEEEAVSAGPGGLGPPTV